MFVIGFFIVMVSIILIILGIVSILIPEDLVRFSHRYDFRGGEPTEFAIFKTKLGGYISIVLGILLITFIIF